MRSFLLLLCAAALALLAGCGLPDAAPTGLEQFEDCFLALRPSRLPGNGRTS